MVNKEIYSVVDTSCRMVLIHQAAILHFEMIHQACLSKTVCLFCCLFVVVVVVVVFLLLFFFFLLFWLVGHDLYSELLDCMSKWPGKFSVMHGFIYNCSVKAANLNV